MVRGGDEKEQWDPDDKWKSEQLMQIDKIFNTQNIKQLENMKEYIKQIRPKRIRHRLQLLAALSYALADGAKAGQLDPSDFASLGPNPFTADGTYTINSAATPPVLTKPDAST